MWSSCGRAYHRPAAKVKAVHYTLPACCQWACSATGVSGSSRAQGKTCNGEGVEQGTEDGGGEQHGAHWRGSKCSWDVVTHTLILSSLLLSFGLHPTPCLHFCEVDDREYACCLAVIHVSDKSVHLLQNCMCLLLLVSLLSQQPFPCQCCSTTLIWSRYLSLCFCLFLTWTYKHPFLRTLEGLYSSIKILFFFFFNSVLLMTESWFCPRERTHEELLLLESSILAPGNPRPKQPCGGVRG